MTTKAHIKSTSIRCVFTSRSSYIHILLLLLFFIEINQCIDVLQWIGNSHIPWIIESQHSLWNIKKKNNKKHWDTGRNIRTHSSISMFFAFIVMGRKIMWSIENCAAISTLFFLASLLNFCFLCLPTYTSTDRSHSARNQIVSIVRIIVEPKPRSKKKNRNWRMHQRMFFLRYEHAQCFFLFVFHRIDSICAYSSVYFEKFDLNTIPFKMGGCFNACYILSRALVILILHLYFCFGLKFTWALAKEKKNDVHENRCALDEFVVRTNACIFLRHFNEILCIKQQQQNKLYSFMGGKVSISAALHIRWNMTSVKNTILYCGNISSFHFAFFFSRPYGLVFSLS